MEIILSIVLGMLLAPAIIVLSLFVAVATIFICIGIGYGLLVVGIELIVWVGVGFRWIKKVLLKITK